MSVSPSIRPRRAKGRRESRAEFLCFLGLMIALPAWGIANLAGVLDPLSRAGAFSFASAEIIMLLCLQALCSFLLAIALRLPHPEFRSLAKIVLVIDGGCSLFILSYYYLIFVIMGGFVAQRSLLAVWIVGGLNVALILALIPLRKLVGKRLRQWFQANESQQNDSHKGESA